MNNESLPHTEVSSTRFKDVKDRRWLREGQNNQENIQTYKYTKQTDQFLKECVQL